MFWYASIACWIPIPLWCILVQYNIHTYIHLFLHFVLLYWIMAHNWRIAVITLVNAFWINTTLARSYIVQLVKLTIITKLMTLWMCTVHYLTDRASFDKLMCFIANHMCARRAHPNIFMKQIVVKHNIQDFPKVMCISLWSVSR